MKTLTFMLFALIAQNVVNAQINMSVDHDVTIANSLKKRMLTDKRPYKSVLVTVEKNNESGKIVKFAVDGIIYKYEIFPQDQYNNASRFYRNNTIVDFFIYDEQAVHSNLYGSYSIYQKNKIFVTTYKTEFGSFLCISGNAYDAQGRLANVEHVFFLPINANPKIGYYFSR